jgi:hypothetical protein
MQPRLYMIDLKLWPAGARKPLRNEQIRLTIGSGTPPSWQRLLRVLGIDPARIVSGTVDLRINEQGPGFAYVAAREGCRNIEL